MRAIVLAALLSLLAAGCLSHRPRYLSDMSAAEICAEFNVPDRKCIK